MSEYFVVENFVKNVETHKTHKGAEDACNILNAHQNDLLDEQHPVRAKYYSIGKDPYLQDSSNKSYDVASEFLETSTEYAMRMGHDM